MIDKPFIKNLGILSESQQQSIHKQNIIVVGCGGIGGYVATQLVRLGVSKIILVDFDTFDRTNLNRQLYATKHTIGQLKVDVLANELHNIHPAVTITTYNQSIEDVSPQQLQGATYLVDGVDTPQTKVYLNQLATTLDIPLVHGACAGWYAQVGIIEPGCMLLQEVYQTQTSGIEQTLQNAAFVPALTASYMVSEWLKHLINDTSKTTNQLLLIDCKNNTIDYSGRRDFDD
ncbi:HesA/MoeB/ThiF family protein [Candidatus Xianfuyuplasma coldseepsis]|uniref:HesA/MoeB/ThiF family protein n=1 Tax=Candidatus Xianfuyuplasma coldseepsis TaxID=2782163 RepID=A0A7L7KQP5_9MOLU|nr:ThiF family adenylyltransferase [Xianfuyuplasma coldseepsis]QMS85140.1 HesA/MoeB/ThiF family protein [Xianfuyuplasma coldseepsis]